MFWICRFQNEAKCAFVSPSLGVPNITTWEVRLRRSS